MAGPTAAPHDRRGDDPGQLHGALVQAFGATARSPRWTPHGDVARTLGSIDALAATGRLSLDHDAMAAWAATETRPATLAGLWRQPQLCDQARLTLARRWRPAALVWAASGDARALDLVAAASPHQLRAGLVELGHQLHADRLGVPATDGPAPPRPAPLAAHQRWSPAATATAALAGHDPALDAILARLAPLGTLGALARSAQADPALAATITARIRGANESRHGTAVTTSVLGLCAHRWPPAVHGALRRWLDDHRPPAGAGHLAATWQLASHTLDGDLATADPAAYAACLAAVTPFTGDPRPLPSTAWALFTAAAAGALTTPLAAAWLGHLDASGVPLATGLLDDVVTHAPPDVLAALDQGLCARLAPSLGHDALVRLVTHAPPHTEGYAAAVLTELHRHRRPPPAAAIVAFEGLDTPLRCRLLADPDIAHVLLPLEFVTLDEAFAAPAHVALVRYWDPAALLTELCARLGHDPVALEVLAAMPGAFLSLHDACRLAVAATAAHRHEPAGPTG